MAHIHARQGKDRKRTEGNFTPQGKHGRSGQSNGNGHGKRGKKYAKFSNADKRQAELAAKGGSLLGDMPLVKEAEQREQRLGGGSRRLRR